MLIVVTISLFTNEYSYGTTKHFTRFCWTLC